MPKRLYTFITLARIVKCLALLLCLPLLITQSKSQQPSSRVGVFVNGLLANYPSDFLRVPGTLSCCEGYNTGTGSGVAVGGSYDVYLTEGLFLSARLVFASQTFSMLSNESTTLIVDGMPVSGTFAHELSGDFSTIAIEPALSYRIVGALSALGGARAGMISSSSYTQRERILEPANAGVFVNPDGSSTGQRVRNVFSGALPAPSFQLGLFAGLRYDLPLNSSSTLLLSPELSYHVSFTDVISDVNWKANGFRFGASIAFVIPSSTVETQGEAPADTSQFVRNYPPVASPPPVTINPPMIAARISAVGVDADGREHDIATVKVEEFSATLMTPLLRYVFFDEGESAIPSRYNSLNEASTKVFDVRDVNSIDKLQTYHHILNIVGKRLVENPLANLQITGYNDGQKERAMPTLSLSRSEAVKAYIVKTFGVRPDRITTSGKQVPLMASSSQSEEGNQENRRVELSSNTNDILAPLVTSDTIRTSNPPTIRFTPYISSDTLLSRWKLEVRTDQRLLQNYLGDSAVPKSIDMPVSNSLRIHEGLNKGNIHYLLTASDVTGRQSVADGFLPFEYVTIHRKRIERVGDKQIDLYSLILFDVRSSEITAANRSILSFIQQRLEPNARVSVTGYTDERGDQVYNQKLAQDRATNIASKITTGEVVSTVGKGNTNLYDNRLPEGRFYSRTVDVKVETPIKQ